MQTWEHGPLERVLKRHDRHSEDEVGQERHLGETLNAFQVKNALGTVID